jgi:hypothetical protein
MLSPNTLEALATTHKNKQAETEMDQHWIIYSAKTTQCV